ncbi:hypothetical protein [Actomonas aquatica]|uniref:Regulator of microtubule dynamics protein 1 n=1 Tax=Actomonas aquatica TaxID=2866162 RepID=A0ABZ1CDQ6_9BACT|nr:hypothetical protein [Opitutus sp. WL0086]WRQ89816.1 hypothetical protein K1X11_010400 [Opitutus sp. WL0086]
MNTPRILSRALPLILTGLFAAAVSTAFAETDDPDALLQRALQAEDELRSQDALDLFLQLEDARPDDPFILQKIARQYSDAIVDLEDLDRKRAYAEQAITYAKRAAELAPDNAENVLSVAVARGKLATYSDNRTKVKLSREIKTDAERALALDPDYAWAHHVLGRWHREVDDLGSVARFFVSLIYGGLPDASLDDAISHLERAVELEPDALAHHLELGFAYQAAGRIAEAQEQLEYGLQLPSQKKHDEIAKARARQQLASIRSG